MNPAPAGGGDRCEPVSGSLSIDDTLEILTDRRRRLVLEYCVSAAGETVDVDDLVEHLAERRERLSGVGDRDAVRTSLHHVHLPMLASKGVVEFDPRSGQLRYHSDDRLEEWLERVNAADDPGPS